MNLSYSNYKKNISAHIIKEAKLLVAKKAVRDIDEEIKDKYVAYVDVGAESFDVQLSFKKDEIVKHECDCQDIYFFCVHKTALLIHLQEFGVKSTAIQVKKTKKTSAFDSLMENVTLEELKAWVATVFKSNKSYIIDFEQYFSQDKLELDPAKIIARTNEIAISIVGKRIKPNANELKKMASLWAHYHGKILEAIGTNILDENNLNCLNAIIITCVDWDRKFYRSSSKKLSDYIETFPLFLSSKLTESKGKKNWIEMADVYLIQIQQEKQKRVNDCYFKALMITIHESSGELKDYLLEQLLTNPVQNKLSLSYMDEASYSLLYMIADTPYAKKYIDNFKLHDYNGAYNLVLIQNLIACDYADKALQYCELFTKNRNDPYYIPFWELMLELYHTKKDTKGIITTLRLLKRWVRDKEYL